MTAIKIERANKSYKKRPVLIDLSLEVPKGSVTALVGENGAGKTTLLHILAGLTAADSGNIFVCDSTPNSSRRWLSRMGFVDQDASLNGSLSIAKHSLIGKDLNYHWNETLLMERIIELKIPTDRPVKQLSGGQRHSAAVLLALAKEPDLLLLDEPLASLDPLSRRLLIGILLSHCYEHGTTVLLSSHLITDLERSCNHLILLTHGSISLSASTEELQETHFWINNSPQNLEILSDRLKNEMNHLMDCDSRFMLCTPDRALATRLNATPAGLEEIVIARMSGNQLVDLSASRGDE